MSTHDYGGVRFQVQDWQRVWVGTTVREHAFLSAMPKQGSAIQGMKAKVPNANWSALDKREFAYDRTPITHLNSSEMDVALYRVKPDLIKKEDTSSILLSYLDVVIQGYHQNFGIEGVKGFFKSTIGWDRPILDDRSCPIYPRHQTLSKIEQGLVDDWIISSSAMVKQLM